MERLKLQHLLRHQQTLVQFTRQIVPNILIMVFTAHLRSTQHKKIVWKKRATWVDISLGKALNGILPPFNDR